VCGRLEDGRSGYAARETRRDAVVEEEMRVDVVRERERERGVPSCRGKRGTQDD
jgi:hypothetical protein